MSVDKIIKSWKSKEFKPIYFFDGDEDFYIDLLINYAEKNILSPEEASFNLTVFYGKDADWTAVINSCKRYPMFADKQVVLIKEAQHMKDFDKLEPYFESPLSSTILIIGYKAKGFDKRTKVYKQLVKNAEVFSSLKLRDDKIHDWISIHVQSKGYAISSKAIILLEEHLGNDLSKIDNEIEKISVNLKGKKSIDEDDIERFIGISKDYNVFELVAAIARKDLVKAIKIVNYFESNPKSGSIHSAIPALYSFFSKVYKVYGMNNQSEAALRPLFYNNPVSLKQAQATMKNYGYAGIEKLILLMSHYNLKSIGIGDAGSGSGSLMREMVVKMIIKED